MEKKHRELLNLQSEVVNFRHCSDKKSNVLKLRIINELNSQIKNSLIVEIALEKGD